MKSVKRIRSKAKKKSEAKTNRLKRVRGSLKGTRVMEVFVSERKRERKLARSTAKKNFQRQTSVLPGSPPARESFRSSPAKAADL